MAEHTPTTSTHVVHHAEMPEEHPERHEHTDVSVRGIWITVGSILVVTAIVHVLLYVVFFAYEGAQARQDELERRSALDIRPEDQGPPKEIARLQGIESFNADTPAVDNQRMELENRRLTRTWGQTPDGKVRIPIDRAMQIALERKLFPARQGAGTTSTQQATTQPAGGGHAGQ